jgi:hypothetical protein
MEDIFDEEVDVVYIVKKGDANKCDKKSADIPITRQVPGLQGLKKISTERTRKSLKGSLSLCLRSLGSSTTERRA